MTIRDRISLTWNYGRTQFIVGLAYNVICARLLASGISYTFFVDAIIVKAFLYAATLFLVSQLRNRDSVFFYINLGISKRKLQLSILLIDFLALIILMTAVLIING